jgi:hypothetical protein
MSRASVAGRMRSSTDGDSQLLIGTDNIEAVADGMETLEHEPAAAAACGHSGADSGMGASWPAWSGTAVATLLDCGLGAHAFATRTLGAIPVRSVISAMTAVVFRCMIIMATASTSRCRPPGAPVEGDSLVLCQPDAYMYGSTKRFRHRDIRP